MDMGIGGKLPRIDQPQHRITAAPQGARGGEASTEPQEVFRIPPEVLNERRIDWSSPKYANFRKEFLVRQSEALMGLQEIEKTSERCSEIIIDHNNSVIKGMEEKLKNIPSGEIKERLLLMEEINSCRRSNIDASRDRVSTSNFVKIYGGIHKNLIENISGHENKDRLLRDVKA